MELRIFFAIHATVSSAKRSFSVLESKLFCIRRLRVLTVKQHLLKISTRMANDDALKMLEREQCSKGVLDEI